MKYTLDTIPVLDAFKSTCQCPLCQLAISCEDGYIDSLLSSAYMEPEVRIETNKTGFCPQHFALMYARRNKLGLSLMTHTHMKEFLPELKKILDDSSQEKSGPLPFFRGKQKSSKAEMLRNQICRCHICTQVDTAMRRYAYTVIRLYLDKAEFRDLMRQKGGVCLPHTALLLELAEEAFSAKECQEFEAALSQITLEHLTALEKDLYDFTLQFDYRNAGKTPDPRVRDSVERAVNRLAGAIVGTEAERPAHND